MLFQIVHKSPTKIINMGKRDDQRNASYYAFKKIKKKKTNKMLHQFSDQFLTNHPIWKKCVIF
jgi:ribosomal protein S7